MLDIDSLRLTDEEYQATLQQELPAGFSYFSPQILADAQLAKTLWGIQAWLDDEAQIREKAYLAAGGSRALVNYLETSASNLRDKLLAAGMTRPEGE